MVTGVVVLTTGQVQLIGEPEPGVLATLLRRLADELERAAAQRRRAELQAALAALSPDERAALCADPAPPPTEDLP